MYTFLFLSLFLLPILYAERFEVELDDNQGWIVPRSAAVSYLFGQPIRRWLNTPLDSSSLLDQSNLSQQRAKRIYWENLAFHAADFHQKAKKINRY